MPILNIRKERTVDEFCRNFRSETGLNLRIYHQNRTANCSLTLRDLFDAERSRLGHKNFGVFEEGLMVFKCSASPAEIKYRLMHDYYLNCDILDLNGSIISGDNNSRDFTPEISLDYEALHELNRRLSLLQKEVLREGKKMKAHANAYYKKSRWLKDFKFCCKISYALRDEDPVLGQGLNDGFFFRHEIYICPEEKDSIYSTKHDWHCSAGMDFPCCYLFYELNENYEIELTDMQRIRSFWLEYIVDFYHFYELRKPGKKP